MAQQFSALIFLCSKYQIVKFQDVRKLFVQVTEEGHGTPKIFGTRVKTRLGNL